MRLNRRKKKCRKKWMVLTPTPLVSWVFEFILEDPHSVMYSAKTTVWRLQYNDSSVDTSLIWICSQNIY